MKSTALDMAEESVLLVRKFICRVKNREFDVALISHVSDDEFNKESDNNAASRSLVEDIIEGDEDKSPPRPTGRGHRMQT